jgi:general secretion pathway protein A
VSNQLPFIPFDGSRSRAGQPASLTYESFYGLREKPFSLSANPKFLYRSPSHSTAFEELVTAIRRREGLVVLTGDIGTGKTTLCRAVLDGLDRKTFSTFVPDPFVSREDLLKTLLLDFGIMSIDDLKSGRLKGASRTDLSYSLYEFLDSLAPLDAMAVVIIDEAQNLSLPLLEEIRILSDLEGREKLLQVVLVGQPELKTYLKLPQMRQVDQRVTVRCEIEPLGRAGVSGYVAHRLFVASGGNGVVDFSTAALDAVYEASRGVPRVVNLICDRALQLGYLDREPRIEGRVVMRAIDRLGFAAAGGPVPAGNEGTTVIAPAIEFDPEAPPVSVEPVAPAAGDDQPPEHTQAPAPAPAAHVAPVPATVEVESDRPNADEPSALDLFAAETGGEIAAPLTTKPAAVPPGPFERYARAAEIDTSTSRRVSPLMAALLVPLAFVTGAGGWFLYAVVQVRAEGPGLPTLPPPPASSLSRPAHPLRMPAPVEEGSSRAEAQRAADLTAAGAAQPALTLAVSPYVIEVASFQSRDRADRLLDELTTTGFRAYLVDLDMGNERGRYVQVMVGWYDALQDAEADLARIRSIPGYSDARLRGTPSPSGTR